VLTPINEFEAGAKREVSDRRRYEDFARQRGRRNSLADVKSDTAQITAVTFYLSGVDANANLQLKRSNGVTHATRILDCPGG